MKRDLANALVEATTSPDLHDVVIDISEVGLDRLLDEGVLKDLPVVGSIVGISQAALDVRDRIFLAKVAKFLLSIDKVSDVKREKFRQKLKSDPRFRKRLGDTLVILLDMLDDLEKAAMLAKVFTTALEARITFDDFRRIGSAVNLAYIDDLRALIAKNDSALLQGSAEHLGNLLRSGLSEVKGLGRGMSTPRMITVGTPPIEYRLTKTGTLFVFAMTGVLWGRKSDFPSAKID